MFLADTLSRAHLAAVHVCGELENIEHMASPAMPTGQLECLGKVASAHPIMEALRNGLRGWPPSKSGISRSL